MENCLQDKKIRVEYIPKFDTIFNVNKSPAKEGMHVEAKRQLPVPANFLTDGEIKFLEQKLHRKLDPESSFWKEFQLPALGVRTFELDLSDPIQWMQWKGLSFYRIIASTPEEEKKRPKEIRWRMIDPDEQHKFRSKSAKDKNAAWRIYGKLEESKSKDILLYIYFLIKSKARAYNDVTMDDLGAYFEPILDEDPSSFIFKAEEEDIKTKALVYVAWMAKVITKKTEGFYYGEEKLFENGEDGNFADAAKYLNNPMKQTLKFEIEAAFKKTIE